MAGVSGGERDAAFFAGFDKISAAFIKWHLRQKRGVEYLYAGGIEHLQTVSQEKGFYMDIDLPDHIAKLSTHFRTVVADPLV